MTIQWLLDKFERRANKGHTIDPQRLYLMILNMTQGYHVGNVRSDYIITQTANYGDGFTG